MPIKKSEFWEWIDTYPYPNTPDEEEDDQYTVTNIDEGVISIVFNVDEDEEEE